MVHMKKVSNIGNEIQSCTDLTDVQVEVVI